MIERCGCGRGRGVCVEPRGGIGGEHGRRENLRAYRDVINLEKERDASDEHGNIF